MLSSIKSSCCRLPYSKCSSRHAVGLLQVASSKLRTAAVASSIRKPADEPIAKGCHHRALQRRILVQMAAGAGGGDEPSACPKCSMANTYFDGAGLFCCPDCGHEWSADGVATSSAEGETIFKDAHGTVLSNGDSVILVKDLKAGGTIIKKGTKIKRIKLGDFEDGHDVDAKIPGVGGFLLKSQFLKKVDA